MNIDTSTNFETTFDEADYVLSAEEVREHNAGRPPEEVGQAPPEIVAALGEHVDENGNVRAADPNAAKEGGHEAQNHGTHSHETQGHGTHEAQGHETHAGGSDGAHEAGSHGGGAGDELNVHNVYESAKDAGIDADKFLAEYVADEGNFNPGQTDPQKMIGALTVLNDLAASVTMGGLEGKGEQEIMQIAGQATTAARQAVGGDASELREILTEAGGNVEGFGDEQLLEMWTTNSHYYNHAILNNDSDGFTTTHLRQLNDEVENRTEPLGGFDNNMKNPQNNFFAGITAFTGTYVPESFPNPQLQQELLASARGGI